jgi:hypothetical protein
MNPCPKCQSFGKCSGSCWLLNVTKTSERIDREMQTPEFKALVASCVPYCEPVGSGYGQSHYWRWKALGEML